MTHNGQFRTIFCGQFRTQVSASVSRSHPKGAAACHLSLRIDCVHSSIRSCCCCTWHTRRRGERQRGRRRRDERRRGGRRCGERRCGERRRGGRWRSERRLRTLLEEVVHGFTTAADVHCRLLVVGARRRLRGFVQDAHARSRARTEPSSSGRRLAVIIIRGYI